MRNESETTEVIGGASPPRRSVCKGHPVTASMVVTALLTAGCATTPSTGTSGGAVSIAAGPAQPGAVEGYLTSGFKELPYTAEELADSARRSIVEQCERAGGKGCREQPVPVDRRQAFARDADPGVYAQFLLRQLSAGQSYTSSCHFVDPAGSTVKMVRNSITVPLQIPSDFSMTFTCRMPLGGTKQLGKWAVHYAVNGETASTLRFEILAVGERSV